MQVRVTAVDATTGATVAGVVVSGVSLSVDTEDVVDQTPVHTNDPIMFLPA